MAMEGGIRIIKCVNEGIVCSLSKDVEAHLKCFHKNDAPKALSFIQNLLQSVLSYLKPLNSLSQDEEQNITRACISCLEFFKNDLMSSSMKDAQVECVLYYIIEKYLSLKQYKEAVKLSVYLQLFFYGFTDLSSEKTKLQTVINNSIILFRKAAVELEKESDQNFRFNVALQLRAATLVFCTMCPSEVHLLGNKICHALQQYYDEKNQCFDPQQVVTFLNTVWHAVMLGSSSKTVQLVKKLLYFQIIYKCDSFFMKHTNSSRVLAHLPKWLCNLKSRICETSDSSNSTRLLHTAIDILASYFELLVSQKSVPPLLLAEWNEILNTGMWSKEEMEIIYLMCSFISTRVYVSILEQIKDTNMVLQYISIAKKTATCFVPLFSSSDAFSESSMEHYNSAIGIGNLGIICYKRNLFEEAIPFLKCSIELQLSTNCGNEEWLWKKQELLIYCYSMAGMYLEALATVAEAFSFHSDKLNTCVKMWLKTKKMAHASGSGSDIAKTTICMIVKQHKIILSTEQCLNFLMQEIRSCNSERRNLNEECLAAISHLLKISPKGLYRARSLVLAVEYNITHQIDSPLLSEIGSSEDMCQEALEIFENWIAKNPNDVTVKLDSSVLHFWMYHVKWMKQKQTAKEEIEKPVEVLVPDEDMNGAEGHVEEKDKNDKCDVVTSFASVTAAAEMELLAILSKAVSIWLEFCKSSDNTWSQVLDVVQSLNLLNIVRATAKYFAQSTNDYNELRALTVLRDMAKSAGNQVFELSALHSILSLVTRLGYLKMAGAIVSYVELNILASDIPKDDSFHAEKLKFYVAKSNYFLQSEQFHPGLELLLRILKDPFLELNQRTPMLIKAEAQLLSSMYLLLPPEAFSNRDFPTIHFAEDTPIRLAVESLKIALRLIKYQSKGPEKKFAHGADLAYPPELMFLLMRSTVLVGTLYTEIGSPRDARCFLQECLLLSQKSILTYWSSKFLATLAHVDLLCDNLEDCEVKLRGLKHMLNTSSHSSDVSSVPPKKNIPLKNEESFRDSNFLNTRSGRTRKGWIRQQMIKSESIGMSPVVKWLRKKDEHAVHLHPDYCSCQYCEFFSLQMVNLETVALSCQYLLAKGEIMEARAELSDVLKAHETIMTNPTIPKAFNLISDITIPDSCAKVLRKSDLSVLVNSLISLNQISMDQGDYSAAVSYIGAAISKLNSCAKYSKHMFADLYGSVIYSKIVSLIKILSTSELPTSSLCLANTWFGKKNNPVDLIIPELVGEISKLNVGCETPKNRKFPIIDVEDFSSVTNKKSSLTQEMCKAPIKRDLLSSAMKNYLSVAESSSKSSGTSSSSTLFVVDVSNSDDDCAFISPSNSDSDMKDSRRSRVPSRRMRSTTRNTRQSSMSSNTPPVAEQAASRGSKKTKPMRKVKRLGVEKHSSNTSPDIVYKFFTSKRNFTIKSSEDIWSQSLNDSNGNQLPASNLNKAKTVKPRAPSATAAPRKMTRTRRNVKDNKVSEVKDILFSPSVDLPISELLCLGSKSPTSSSLKQSSGAEKSDDQIDVERARGVGMPLPEASHLKTTRGFCNSVSDDCEKEEAKFSITRCSISEPYTPKFIGIPYDQNFLAKPSLTEIAAVDLSSIAAVRIEELIFELKEAMLLLEHHPPCPLYGNMCLLLALLSSNKTQENSDKDHKNKLDICYLISESFAVTLRHQSIIRLSKLIREPQDNGKDDKKCLSPSPETEIISNLNAMKQKNLNFSKWTADQLFSDRMKQLQNVLPADWTVVQVHAFPEILNTRNTSKPQAPKLVLCQYRRNSAPCVSVIDNNADPLFATNFLSLFETIIRESTLTMTNKDAKEWWTLRRSLDTQMKELTESMENIWLGCWKGLFLGLPSSKERMTQLCKAVYQVKSHAESLGCFHVDKELLQAILDSSDLLSSQQLSTAISQLWNLPSTDSVLQELTKYIHNLSISLPATGRNPVLLILDKHVQALPWESMPMLKDVPVTRIPSVSLLNAQLESFNLMGNSSFHNGIQSGNTFYIVNPGGDLLKTQEAFEEVFKQQTDWKGIIGRIPSCDEFKSAITGYDLFLYLGHGTGKNYLTGECIEKHPCQATTLLMGCSSGRLKLLGRQLEPAGVVLQYFLGGSPCIVGNLWDVTDKDIDRFTQTLLETWLPNYGKQSEPFVNVATAISTARNSCKLPFLIGAAPVVYGLPVFARS